MSTESLTWLNKNTLIGYGETAWHRSEAAQGDEDNHYPGPIPVEDVTRRLFHWTPVEGTVETTYLTDEGVTHVVDPTRKTIVRPDTQDVLGIFKADSYQIHGYTPWLIENVELITDNSDLGIASAGLLAKGGVAWVTFQLEQSLEAAGFAFNPFFLAATSLNGSLSSTYKLAVNAPVCDNTLSAALSGSGAQVKVRHSSQSLGKVQDVRDAMGLIITAGDQFAAKVEALVAEKVDTERFLRWADAFTGLSEEKDSKRSKTIAENKKAQLVQLWADDERVTPWAGTAFGVLQAANTWQHWVAGARNKSQAERNMTNVIFGEVDKMDAHALKLLASV